MITSPDPVSFATADPLHAQRKRIFRRIVPLLFGVLILNFIDRQNVSYAALEMNKDLGFTATVYGFGAAMFFLGYQLFNLPVSLMVARLGVRISIAAMMFAWGAVAMAMAFVWSPSSLYGARFLLGVADAGIIPAVMLCLNQWFPETVRGRATGAILAAPLLSGVIVGPISGVILELPAWHGIEPWQWLFLLEGLPTLILAVFVLRLLPNSPNQAQWLTEPERQAWMGAIAESRRQVEMPHALSGAAEVLKDSRLWLLSAMFFCLGATLHTLILWLPQMIAHVQDMRPLLLGTFGAVPFLFGAIAVYYSGWLSDRTGHRDRYIIAGALVAATACAACGSLMDHPMLAYAALLIALIGHQTAGSPMYTMIGSLLQGRAAAVGYAIATMSGSIGGFAGNAFLGWARDRFGSFVVGLYAMAFIMLMAAVVMLIVTRRARRTPAYTQPSVST